MLFNIGAFFRDAPSSADLTGLVVVGGYLLLIVVVCLWPRKKPRTSKFGGCRK